MRTTINLDDHLMHRLKKLAMDTHQTLTAVIEDSLRFALFKRAQAKDRPRVTLPTFNGELQPGVDLDNNAALLELMEKDDSSRR